MEKLRQRLNSIGSGSETDGESSRLNDELRRSESIRQELARRVDALSSEVTQLREEQDEICKEHLREITWLKSQISALMQQLHLKQHVIVEKGEEEEEDEYIVV